MMTISCFHCNEVLPEDASFCSSCGKQEPALALVPPCTRCSWQSNHVHYIHCSSCGLQLLPTGWEALLSPEGDLYYENRELGQTEWARPAAPAPVELRPSINARPTVVSRPAAQSVVIDDCTLVHYGQQFCSLDKRNGKGGKYDSVEQVVSWEPATERTKDGGVQRLGPDLAADAQKVWRWVTGCMGDRKMRSKKYEDLFHGLCLYGLTKRDALRDEIFLVIIKQVNNNPNSESAVKGWILLQDLLLRFGPGNRFRPYLTKYVRDVKRIGARINITSQLESVLMSIERHTINKLCMQMYAEKYFDRVLLSNGHKIPAIQLHCFHKSLPQPLQKLKSDLFKDALKEFKHITRFINGNEAAKTAAFDKMVIIADRNPGRDELKDEVYCQLIRMACRCPDVAKEASVYELWSKCLMKIKPTRRLFPYMLCHVTVLLNNPDVAEPARVFLGFVHQSLMDMKGAVMTK